jgi:three-Cys-motif partner protein
VVVPWGPKIVVATGDANNAHWALKTLVPAGRRYVCAVIDPQSAIYEWQALEGLVFREKAMDVLMLFPDEMDFRRALPYYLRSGGGAKLDRYFPTSADWRSTARASTSPPSALRRLYEVQMERLLDFKIGHPKTVSMDGRTLYRLVFATRDSLGLKLWHAVSRRAPNYQDELPFFDV